MVQQPTSLYVVAVGMACSIATRLLAAAHVQPARGGAIPPPLPVPVQEHANVGISWA